MGDTPKRSHGATGPFYHRRPLDAEVIRQGIEDGRKTMEIADDLGTSSPSVYRAAAKAGLPLCRGRVQHPQTLRRAVEDMRPVQALEYVLEAV